MSLFKRAGFRRLFLCLPLLCVALSARAQSLILAIPNADVAHKGRLEFMHESQIRVEKPGWNSFNILTTGVTDRTEASIGIINLDPTIVKGATFMAGIKHVVPLNKGPHEWKYTVGGNIGYSPRMEQPYRQTGVFAYSHISMRVPGLGTRLTGGATFGTPHFFGFRPRAMAPGELRPAGYDPLYKLVAMAGVEQPITKRLAFMADWFSHDHVQGALISGFQYDFGMLAVLAAYKLPNGDLAKDAIVTELVFDIPYRRAAAAHAH